MDKETELDDYKRRISEIVQDPRRWPADEESLGHLLRDVCIVSAVNNDPSLAQSLGWFYGHCRQQLSDDTRYGIYRYLNNMLMEGQLPLDCLLPLIFFEPNSSIVSSATLDYVQLKQPDPDDPLSTIRLMIRVIENNPGNNAGGVLAGLLNIGDDRSLPLLISVRQNLAEDDVKVAARCTNGIPSQLAYEFWIDWLESLVDAGNTEYGIYGCAATALPWLRRQARVDSVFAIQRNFGYRPEAGEDPLEIIEDVPFEEFAARISDRLYALEEEEPAPKIMSDVLKSMGLEPRAPVHLRAKPLYLQ